MKFTDPRTELPNDLEAEKGILGACSLSPMPSLVLASNALTEGDFYNQEYGKFFGILKSMLNDGTAINPATIADRLARSELNAGELLGTILICGDAREVKAYIRRILAKSGLRKMFQACYKACQDATDSDADPEIIGNEVTNAIQAAQSTAEKRVGLTAKELWLDLLERMQTKSKETAPIPTGIEKLDKLTRGGIRRGQMGLLGALRHVGKTALARQFAINAGMKDYSVYCFFAESSDNDEAGNTMSVMSGVETKEFTGDGGTITKGTKDAMMRVLAGKAPSIRIDTEPNISMDLIESKLRYMHATLGVDLVFIDYLQFLRMGNEYKGQTRENMISEAARRIKVLARQLDIAIWLLVQLNDEISPEEVPEIRHIRESKGPSNHADIILLMSAPAGIAHDPTDADATQERILWNRKWRGVGAFQQGINLQFKGSTQQFINS